MFNKITVGAITAIAAMAPVVFVTSCGATNNYEYKDYSFSSIDWTKQNYKDATIVSWIDGDTPIVILKGGSSSVPDTDLKNLKTQNPSETGTHIRIASIDTPELHTKGEDGKINVLTKGKEFEWADKGREFGNNEMKPGTKIRILTSGSMSYQRLVGSIFYGEHFEKMYSVEILKKGLAFPFIDNALAAYNKNSIEHHSYRAIADAYNYAKNNKVGIWDPSVGEVSVIHGSTNVVPVTDFHSDEENKRKRTVYYYTKDL